MGAILADVAGMGALGQRNFYGRAGFAFCTTRAASCANCATNGNFCLGQMIGMLAVVAKEAGIVGASFTSAHSETLTGPIDAVLAVPNGYQARTPYSVGRSLVTLLITLSAYTEGASTPQKSRSEHS
jgi:hypothetical protein